MPEKILEFQGEWRFLSNFWDCEEPIGVGTVNFRTVEQAYQYSKAVMLGDEAAMKKLVLAASPGISKRLSHSIKGDRTVWEERKVGIMTGLVAQKFQPGFNLSKRLFLTGKMELEEGNKWGDRFWGVSPVGSGNGRNELGKILMRIRDELARRDPKRD